MSDGMRRELVYLSSHATNRYFIPNWGIQYELKKAYETLEGMEYDREMCTSVTLRPQYDRMIIEQKQRIAELERQLSEASY